MARPVDGREEVRGREYCSLLVPDPEQSLRAAGFACLQVDDRLIQEEKPIPPDRLPDHLVQMVPQKDLVDHFLIRQVEAFFLTHLHHFHGLLRQHEGLGCGGLGIRKDDSTDVGADHNPQIADHEGSLKATLEGGELG